MVIMCLEAVCGSCFQLTYFYYPLFSLQWKLNSLNNCYQCHASLVRLVIRSAVKFDLTDPIGVSRMARALLLLFEANDVSGFHSNHEFTDKQCCENCHAFHRRPSKLESIGVDLFKRLSRKFFHYIK